MARPRHDRGTTCFQNSSKRSRRGVNGDVGCRRRICHRNLLALIARSPAPSLRCAHPFPARAKDSVRQSHSSDHYKLGEIVGPGAAHGTRAVTLGNFVLVGVHRFVGATDARQSIRPSLKAIRSMIGGGHATAAALRDARRCAAARAEVSTRYRRSPRPWAAACRCWST